MIISNEESDESHLFDWQLKFNQAQHLIGLYLLISFRRNYKFYV